MTDCEHAGDQWATPTLVSVNCQVSFASSELGSFFAVLSAWSTAVSKGFVDDLKAGFSVRYKEWRLSYTFVRRSTEFSPDPVGVDVGRHDYGSRSFSWSPGSFM